MANSNDPLLIFLPSIAEVNKKKKMITPYKFFNFYTLGNSQYIREMPPKPLAEECCVSIFEFIGETSKEFHAFKGREFPFLEPFNKFDAKISK